MNLIEQRFQKYEQLKMQRQLVKKGCMILEQLDIYVQHKELHFTSAP